MEFKQTPGYIVVRNKSGQRKQVKIEEYNEFQNNPIIGHPLDGYKYDLEWDLNHGFTEASKTFERIKNGFRTYQENKF